LNLNRHEIPLPAEDPVGYALDWRCQIATVIAAGNQADVPPEIRNDADIQAWAHYLQRQAKRPAKSDQRYQRLAAWHAGSPIKGILEAMLLTEADYAAIGESLDIGPEDVRLYQTIFFDVRDEQGKLKAPHLLRVRFPAEGRDGGPVPPPMTVLREAALTGGRGMLDSLLQRQQAGSTKAPKPDEAIDRLVQQELLRRLLGGQMQTRDLVRLRHVGLVAQQVQAKVAERTGEDDKWRKAYMEMLQDTAPTLLAVSKSPEQMALAEEALRRRLSMEQKIRRTDIPDAGVPAAQQAVAEKLREHLQHDAAPLNAPVASRKPGG
jgi:hypothetical protein